MLQLWSKMNPQGACDDGGVSGENLVNNSLQCVCSPLGVRTSRRARNAFLESEIWTRIVKYEAFDVLATQQMTVSWQPRECTSVAAAESCFAQGLTSGQLALTLYLAAMVVLFHCTALLYVSS